MKLNRIIHTQHNPFSFIQFMVDIFDFVLLLCFISLACLNDLSTSCHTSVMCTSPLIQRRLQLPSLDWIDLLTTCVEHWWKDFKKQFDVGTLQLWHSPGYHREIPQTMSVNQLKLEHMTYRLQKPAVLSNKHCTHWIQTDFMSMRI